MKCIVVRVLASVLGLFSLAGGMAYSQTTLISTGSVWKYLDTGDDLGTGWRALSFPDGAWLAGPAKLGFGDNDEVTLLSQTNSLGEPNITYYFRQVFNVQSAAVYSNLLVRMRRDDGALVYLNGVEVFRSNLRLGPVDFTTLAPTATPDDGEAIFDIAIDPALLVDGDNILAVEVHQSSTTSSDLTFDLELLGNVPLSFIPIIHRGAIWRYLDDGSDQGTAWSDRIFNDSGWSNGLAQLGFGDGDETTQVRRFSELAGTNAITYYFRHSFNVANLAAITNLVARIVRDDGAIVYLNGAEVYRINMPDGEVTSMTFTPQVIGTDDFFHGFRVNPALLLPGENVFAVEVHQFNLTSSDISFDFELRPNQPLTPPSVAIVTPADDTTFIGPLDLEIDILSRDYDTPVERIELYLDSTLSGTDTSDAYDVNGYNFSIVASNLQAGSYVLRAVAIDTSGLMSTSAPVEITVLAAPLITTLIPSNAVWKYLDTGVDQGIEWREPDFNDQSWPSGPAKLGTNDQAVTVIRIRNAVGMQIPTSYFRHYFTASNAATFTNLAFGVLRDDGCIAYLNGQEIFRMNIQTGPVTFNTFVPSLQAVGSSDEHTYFPTNVTPDLLIDGTNVLAVELHQTSGTSDAGFDLALYGVAPPPAPIPSLTIQFNGATATISWSGTGYLLQEAGAVAGPFNNLPAATSPYVISSPTGNRFYRLTRP